MKAELKYIPRFLRSPVRSFLDPYRRRGRRAYQKARLQLFLLLLCIGLTPMYYMQDLLLDGRNDPTMTGLLAGGLCFLLLLAYLLRSGRYLLSGHCFLFLLAGILWFWMFRGTDTLLNRLDTIALLLGVLIMTPLITNRRGLAIHYGLNAILLLLFHLYNPEAGRMSISERQFYALDSTIAFFLSGYISYLLIRTDERVERGISRSNLKLNRRVNIQTRVLQRTREQLEASRDELHRDMDMARHVQGNFLADRAPETSDWDIAFYFQPCTQVSGDFYDFYSRDGRLEGVGLFDVSGHGVASGLITVLAKSIIQRKFHAMPGETLSRVIEAANDELMFELQNVNNYITGLLIRCGDGYVDSINAGHNDILLRDPDGGVRRLGRADRSHRGTFLGLEFLAGEYPTLRTPVRPGDALLAFSDGITEKADPDGEQYGLDRLIDALHAAPAGGASAKTRMRAILEDLDRFSGAGALTDDITMILMVRRSGS